MNIAIAQTDAQIQSCFPVLHQLRPKLNSDTFVTKFRLHQREGVAMVYLADPDVRAVGVYRIMNMFATGKVLYIDDLITDAKQRSRGYGKKMLEWLKQEATRQGCQFLELDSGHVRKDAHRFYRDNDMEDVALHFSMPVGGGEKWMATIDN